MAYPRPVRMAPAALPEDLTAVREALIGWYEENHRAFPWRETDDPYQILVSEVMSQQTQLDRIVEPWRAFVERWPDAATLAAADRADVLAFWSSHNLGYNNRARYLHEAAGQVLEEFDGEIPADPEALQSLMGVGPYTANAVASFAFNTGDAVVDTNVKRVLYRAFDVPDDDAAFEDAATTLFPEGRSRVWNNAIMELGGVACTKSPTCDGADCPWREWCTAYRTGDFSAPDVPEQAAFEGSRRQMRGRVIDALATHGRLTLAALGPKVRVDYDHEATAGAGTRSRTGTVRDSAGGSRNDPTAAPENGPGWLLELLRDLEGDGLVRVQETESGYEASLER